VLLIPLGAMKTSQNGQSTVQILKSGQAQTIVVETGLSSDSQLEVLSGLSEGQDVITGSTTPAAQTSGGSSSSPFSGGSPLGGGSMRAGGGFGGGR